MMPVQDHGGLGVISSIVLYMMCSGFMLIANKVTIYHVPVPACVFVVQLSFATLCILALRSATKMKVVGHALLSTEIDDFTLINIRTFLPYIAAFVLSVFCNGKALEQSNVDTVIVFRACTPLIVSVLDWAFLGRELPSLRSVAVLSGLLIGALAYVSSDGDFEIRGLLSYGWVTAYLLAIVFETVCAKKLLAKVTFQSPVWGSVLYTNALGFPPMMVIAMFSGELDRAKNLELSAFGISALFVSSTIGLGIGWAAWNCRDKLSATSYTVVGVSCKLISVLLNTMIWEKHASAVGICWLFVCLGCSSLYRQAPLRASSAPDVRGPGTPGEEVAEGSGSVDYAKASYSKIGAPGHEGFSDCSDPGGVGL